MTVTKRAGNDTFHKFWLSGGVSTADLHVKPPSTMGHESLIQRRPSLSHPFWLKYFFSDIPSVLMGWDGMGANKE